MWLTETLIDQLLAAPPGAQSAQHTCLLRAPIESIDDALLSAAIDGRASSVLH